MLNRILRIESIEPFKILCKWSNGETRTIDFEIFLKDKKDKYAKLFDYNFFKNVKLDAVAKSLFWEHYFNSDSKNSESTITQLDFCPDSLYN